MRMRKALRIVLAALFAIYHPALLVAQQGAVTTYTQPEDQRTILGTQFGNSAFTFDIRPGVTSHQLTFVVGPAVSAITVTVTGSSTGPNGSFTSCGSSTSLGATISCTGVFNSIKVAYTGVTGSGPIDATYLGVSSLSTAPTTVTVNQGTAGTQNWKVEVAAITAPATGTQPAASTSAISCATDIHCIVVGSGTAGSPASGVVTIQGIASGVAVPVTSGSNPLLIYAAAVSNVGASTITNTVQTMLTSAFVLTSVLCDNADGTTQNWLQMFDTTGAVTVGTTVPTYPLPLAAAGPGGITQLNLKFSNGLKIAATTGAANSTTASTAIPWCNFSYRSLVNGQ